MVHHNVYVWGDGAPLKPLTPVPRARKLLTQSFACIFINEMYMHFYIVFILVHE